MPDTYLSPLEQMFETVEQLKEEIKELKRFKYCTCDEPKYQVLEKILKCGSCFNPIKEFVKI